MNEMQIDVLRETISDLKGLILIEAHKSKNEELMDRFRLLQSEEDALRDPRTPESIKQSIYDKIKRLYCRSYFREKKALLLNSQDSVQSPIACILGGSPASGRSNLEEPFSVKSYNLLHINGDRFVS